MKSRHPLPCSPVPARRRAFTLIELLASMTVLAFIVTMVAGLSDSASRVWSRGEQTVESYQTGRALLEMMARELSQAVISPRLQFVQDPVLPGRAKQRSSNSLFWVAPLSSTSNGDLCEVGYYLTDTFELKRFFVPPSDTTNYAILTADKSNAEKVTPRVRPATVALTAGSTTTPKRHVGRRNLQC